MKKFLKNKNIKKLIIPIILLLIISFLFMYYYPIISPDSGWYYYLSLIIKGKVSFSNWFVVRGPTLPIYIALITTVFNFGPKGLVLGMLLQFLLLMGLLYYLLYKFNNKKVSKIQNILFVIIILYNPIIFGYSHTLLTEIMAPVLCVMCIILAYNWININKKREKIIYSILFILLSIISWLLKQPYFMVIIGTIFLSFIISLIIKFKTINNLYRLITICLCLASLLLSIKTWDYILLTNDVKSTSNETNNSYISQSIFNGINSYFKIDKDINLCNRETINKNQYLSSKEKQLIKNKHCKDYNILTINNLKSNIIEYDLIYDYQNISTVSAIKTLLKETIKHPILIINSYINNYFATIDVFPTHIENNTYIPIRKFQNVNNENQNLAYVTFTNSPIHWWGYDSNITKEEYIKNYDYIRYMDKYEVYTKYNNNLTKIIEKIYPLYLLLFKFSFVLLPILLLIYIIKFLKNKQEKKNRLLLLIYGSCFIHVLFHVMTGAIIDRYAYIVFPCLLLGFIINIDFKQNNDYIIKNGIQLKIQ